MALLFLHLRSSQNVTLKKLPSNTKPPLLSKHNMLSWLHCEGLMMLLPTKKKRLNLDGSTNNLLRQEGNCSVHLKSPECNTHTTCYPYTILTVHTLKLCKTVMHCWVNHSAHCQVNLRWVKCGWRARSVWCTQFFTTLRAGYDISPLLYCWCHYSSEKKTRTVQLKDWNLRILVEEAVQHSLNKVTQQHWSVMEAPWICELNAIALCTPGNLKFVVPNTARKYALSLKQSEVPQGTDKVARGKSSVADFIIAGRSSSMSNLLVFNSSNKGNGQTSLKVWWKNSSEVVGAPSDETCSKSGCFPVAFETKSRVLWSLQWNDT